MNRILVLTLLMLAIAPARPKAPGNNRVNMEKNNTIRLTVEGGKTFTATLADNSSAQALLELLAKGNVTVEMEDYGPWRR